MGSILSIVEKICDPKSFIKNDSSEVTILETKPFDDQKMGTSGLRKKTKLFMKENYLHNFIQCVFNVFNNEILDNQSLLIAGDGRYFSDKAIQIICEIAAGNGIKHIIIAKNGIASTPACSVIIRKINEKNTEQVSDVKETNVVNLTKPDDVVNANKGVNPDNEVKHVKRKCFAGILLTASHNPGGKNEDFGVKINTNNGGPALEEITDKIFEETKKIEQIKLKKLKKIQYHNINTYNINDLTIEVIDPVNDWLELMKTVFDFDLIKKLTNNKKFKFAYDAFHGATGEYAKILFLKELNISDKFIFNLNSKDDFNKLHPDPNLVYAKKIVDLMKLPDENNDQIKPSDENDNIPDLAAVCDADGDRCMILGKHFFVNPCDSLAIISHYASKCIPYFKNNFKGVARSLPTSKAVDKVFNNKNIYETPTGWKYFVNLMDNDKISLCGEESFGLGCDVIREKDGLFCVLCWLSILAFKNTGDRFISVKDIVHDFWKEFGRYYYCRYDFCDINIDKSNEIINHLNKLVTNELPIYDTVKELNITDSNHRITLMENFTYVDPVTKQFTKNQGIRLVFENDSSIIYRKSGTDSSNATIRIYFQKFYKDDIHLTNKIALKDLINIGLKICKIKDFIGHDQPTVIT